jgi:glycogen(starch) synthase
VNRTAVPAEIKPYSVGESTEYFPDAHFVVAGSDDLLPQMTERAAHREISSRMHFTGFLKAEQTRQVWSVTQVYVMPAGVPVIGSNQSGVAEVMDHICED